MTGFVQSYMAQPPSKDGSYDPRAVMHYFMPEQVPVISTLARAFGVCDQWYASAPCQTWPNRFFAHTGTALGHVDNSTFPVPYPAPSLLRRLEDRDKSWRVYFHDMPQSSCCGTSGCTRCFTIGSSSNSSPMRTPVRCPRTVSSSRGISRICS